MPNHRGPAVACTPCDEMAKAVRQPGEALRQDAAAVSSHLSAPLALSVIMPTVSWTGVFETCAKRVLEVIARSGSPVELVVVYDGQPPPPPAFLDSPEVRLVSTGRQSGPAVARNAAATSARGDILLFVDADVELAPDALGKVMDWFADNPDAAGVFGAYDDEPSSPGIVSQFRNLLHHHTHVAHPGRTGTFWSGCGAIRTAAFLDVAGFDEDFRCPSVEDIDLGMRVTANGGRISLDPSIRCKHLKAWTLRSMVVNDIFQRAIPWTHLIMAAHQMPATLNVDRRGQLSGVFSVAAIAALCTAIVVPGLAWLAVPCLLGVWALNADFHRLCLRKRGPLFAVAAFGLHLLYFVYASITFGLVVLHDALFGRWQSRSIRRKTAP